MMFNGAVFLGRPGGLGSPLSGNPRHAGAVNQGAAFCPWAAFGLVAEDPSSGMLAGVNRVRP